VTDIYYEAISRVVPGKILCTENKFLKKPWYVLGENDTQERSWIARASAANGAIVEAVEAAQSLLDGRAQAVGAGQCGTGIATGQ